MVRNERLIAMRFPNILVKKIDEISRIEEMNRSSLLRKLAKIYIKDFEKKEMENDEISVEK